MDQFSEQMIMKYVKRMYKHNMPTFLHSLRVGDMLYHFVKYLGYDNLKEIYILGVLHDIGKLKIPSTLLNKKEKLTHEEFEEMKRHTIYGEEIVSSLHHLPQDYSKCVLYHHEDFNGMGYFNKKGREEIPFLARAIRVIDTYDTMLFGRIYQKPLNQETVLNELLMLKGINFDPVIVDDFIEMLAGKYSLDCANLLEVKL